MLSPTYIYIQIQTVPKVLHLSFVEERAPCAWVVEHKFNHWRVSVCLKFVICHEPLCRSNETAGPWRAEQKGQELLRPPSGKHILCRPHAIPAAAPSYEMLRVFTLFTSKSSGDFLRGSCWDVPAIQAQCPCQCLRRALCKSCANCWVLSWRGLCFEIWKGLCPVCAQFVPLCELKEMHSKQRQLGGHEGLSMCDAKHVWSKMQVRSIPASQHPQTSATSVVGIVWFLSSFQISSEYISGTDYFASYLRESGKGLCCWLDLIHRDRIFQHFHNIRSHS